MHTLHLCEDGKCPYLLEISLKTLACCENKEFFTKLRNQEGFLRMGGPVKLPRESLLLPKGHFKSFSPAGFTVQGPSLSLVSFTSSARTQGT